jgi:hypothetical protein
VANDDQRRPPSAQGHRSGAAKTQLPKIPDKTQGKKTSLASPIETPPTLRIRPYALVYQAD